MCVGQSGPVTVQQVGVQQLVISLHIDKQLNISLHRGVGGGRGGEGDPQLTPQIQKEMRSEWSSLQRWTNQVKKTGQAESY